MNSPDKHIDTGIDDALASTSTLLKYAASEGLDVTILCSSLDKEVRETKYAKVNNGITYADDLEQVLKSNAKIRLLIWNKLPVRTPELAPGIVNPASGISESFRRLLQLHSPRGLEPAKPGQIDVRITGFVDANAEICHFLCVHGKTPNDWALRIEKPHLPREIGTDRTENGHASGLFIMRDAEAEAIAKLHLPMFENVFNAIEAGVIASMQSQTPREEAVLSPSSL